MRRSGDISFSPALKAEPECGAQPERGRLEHRVRGRARKAPSQGRGCGAEPSPGPGLRCHLGPPAFRFERERAALGAGIPPANRGCCPLPPFCRWPRRGDPQGHRGPVPGRADPFHPRGRRLEINGKHSREKPPTAGTGWLRMGRFLPLLSPNTGTGTASVAVKPRLHRRRNFPESLALDWRSPCVRSPSRLPGRSPSPCPCPLQGEWVPGAPGSQH